MKQILRIMVGILLCVVGSNAQTSKLDKVKRALANKGIPIGNKGQPTNGGGTIVFSKNPIDAGSPANLSDKFASGDPIYALIRVAEPWDQLKKIANSTKTEAKIPLAMTLGGKRLFQYITVKNQDLIKGTHLRLDIAPEKRKMTAYTDPQILYPDAYGSKWGPAAFTSELSQLTSGTHTVTMEITSYGRVYAAGEFTLSGNNYASYASVHEEIKKVIAGNRSFPAAGMTNHDLEANMLALCKNSGWPKITKLVIVDKDWWVDRVSGGNSAISSRHIAAAVGVKEHGGSCFYKTVTFHQHMQINGAFGPLELTHAGDPVQLPANSL